MKMNRPDTEIAVAEYAIMNSLFINIQIYNCIFVYCFQEFK
jgi:hypothetical protein